MDDDPLVARLRAAGCIYTEEAALRVVDTEAFASVWRQANRVAHRRFLRVMRSDKAGPVVLDISPIVDEVLDGVRNSGVPLPRVDTTSSLRIRLASSSAVERARLAYGAVDTFGLLTAAAWGLLLVAALVLGRDRRCGLAVASAATAVTTALLWLALRLGDEVAASAVAATDQQLARAVYDVLTDDLERWALVALAVSVGVALVNALAPRARQEPEQA